MSLYSALIVDDCQDERYLLRRLLSKTGIIGEIFEADDGKTGIDLLADYSNNRKKYPEGFPPAVIFLDLNMPIMGGFKFLDTFTKLKKENDYSSSVIVMFSSSRRQQDVDRSLSYDSVKNFLTKGPISVDALKEKILECFPVS